MSWRGDLLARLKGDATLAALIGTRAAWFEAGRSWGDSYPQLTLQEISVKRDYTHNGHDGLDWVRVQFDVRASTGTSAEAVEARLTTLMEAGGTQGGTVLHPAFLEDRETTTEDLGNQRRVQRLRLDFTFFHETV